MASYSKVCHTAVVVDPQTFQEHTGAAEGTSKTFQTRKIHLIENPEIRLHGGDVWFRKLGSKHCKDGKTWMLLRRKLMACLTGH